MNNLLIENNSQIVINLFYENHGLWLDVNHIIDIVNLAI